MVYAEGRVYYFERPGPENTGDAARFAVERATALGLDTIVVASTSGRTALQFLEASRETGLHLVVVTHAVGFRKPGEWEFDMAAAEVLKAAGATVVTGSHVLSGLERAFSASPKVGGGSRSEAVSEALRRLIAVGLKVAVECVLIAADQGAVPIDREVVACGGTGSGADAVVVVRPAHTSRFFDCQVREIVAMPRDR
ncbi:MAG: pyruvate kinase alpha/beta domain-containing protein [Methanoregulaceae archaeon]